MNYEPIFAALSARLVAGLGVNIKTATRDYKDFDQFGKEDHPVLIVVNQGDQPERPPEGAPTKHYITAFALLYVRDDDPSAQVETQLHSLLDLFATALKFQQPGDKFTPEAFASQSTTLGGLVRYVWIRNVVIHHGDKSGQAAATIVLDILQVDD